MEGVGCLFLLPSFQLVKQSKGTRSLLILISVGQESAPRALQAPVPELFPIIWLRRPHGTSVCAAVQLAPNPWDSQPEGRVEQVEDDY